MTKEADYIEQYQMLHQKELDYGISGSNYYEIACLIIDYLKPKTVLDYGCGKAILITQLAKKYPDIKFYGYDPAISERSTLPIDKADLVINTDVLEHIPEDVLPSVVERISKISDKCFFGIHHALAYTFLPNGENAHCTVKPVFWYYHLFESYFKNITYLRGRESYLSTFITFPLLPEVIKKYEEITDITIKLWDRDDYLNNCIKKLTKEIESLTKENNKLDSKVKSIDNYLKNRPYKKVFNIFKKFFNNCKKGEK